jgi:hypothetical protein
MERLLYVSESYIDQADSLRVVSQIVVDSQLKNTALDITGAILSKGTHFAHIIEGPRSSVEKMIESVGNDQRHGNIHITARRQITQRSFQELKLAYSGSAHYVEHRIKGAFHLPTAWERNRFSNWCTEFASEFLKPPTTKVQQRLTNHNTL